MRAVVLDLGGVVFRLDFGATLRAVGLNDPKQIEQFPKFIGSWEVYDQYERGKLSCEDFFGRLKIHYGLSHEHGQLVDAWNRIIAGPVEGVGECMRRTRKRIPLHALSNTNPAHIENVLSNHPVMSHFDRVFTSVSLGCRKPESEIYLAMAQELKLNPLEILFIDDVQANVDGARRAGLRSEICFDSAERLERILESYGL